MRDDMPDLIEQMYCSQQIFIPSNLPSILKKYAKAAIRTQPGDLLMWSSAYFRALSEGIPPPVKERIEFPQYDTPSGLTSGFMKVLIHQIGKGETVPKSVLFDRWRGICLNMSALQDLLDVGNFEDEVHWLEFVAICTATLQPSLTKTMIQLCELLTDEPEGGRASIPVQLFLNLYKYLAYLDCGPTDTREQYEANFKEDSEAPCSADDVKPTEIQDEATVVDIDWSNAIDEDDTRRLSVETQAVGATSTNDEATVEGEETSNDPEKRIPNESPIGIAESPIDESSSPKGNQDDEKLESQDAKDVVDVLADDGGESDDDHENKDTEDAEKVESELAASPPAEEIEALAAPENDDATLMEEDDKNIDEPPNLEESDELIVESVETGGGNDETAETTVAAIEQSDDNVIQDVNLDVQSNNDDAELNSAGEETEATGEDKDSLEVGDTKPGETDVKSVVQSEIELPSQNYYIIDDDGTLSAPKVEESVSEGLHDRDSDKSVITNVSEEGLMVWPDVKMPEKEELQIVQSLEHEVTSDAGIEVFTDVEAQQQQEELKILSEQTEVKPEASEKDDNIFAPEIESFVEFLEVESAPAEDMTNDEVGETPSDVRADDQSTLGTQSEQGVKEESEIEEASEEIPLESNEESNRQDTLQSDECIYASDEKKQRTKQEGDINVLVKKDSEMMLLPTPTTSDIMLFIDNNCDVSTKKITPSQVLTDKMSLVDMQVGVPVNEIIEEEIEQPRYAKWMNIPGIGPVVPEQVVDKVEKYFLQVSELQDGMVMPRNIRHFNCPPLELSVECQEESIPPEH